MHGYGLAFCRSSCCPEGQAAEDFGVVLAVDGDAADAFVAECIVADPAGIGDQRDAAFAGLGDGEQGSWSVAGAAEGFDCEIVGD